MSYEDILSETLKYSAQLIAVSKLQSDDKIRNLYTKGQRLFAENYVQEAASKQKKLQDLEELEWHFIGSLQKNKVKFVVGKFAYIHSVDSKELAEKINQQAQVKGLRQKILIQVNLADEKSKSGIRESDLRSILNDLQNMHHLEVAGLMTMPPLYDNPELARPYFKSLKNLAEKHQLQELSMGTSADYRVALQEGATMIRLGTILFGERPRNQ